MGDTSSLLIPPLTTLITTIPSVIAAMAAMKASVEKKLASQLDALNKDVAILRSDRDRCEEHLNKFINFLARKGILDEAEAHLNMKD